MRSPQQSNKLWINYWCTSENCHMFCSPTSIHKNAKDILFSIIFLLYLLINLYICLLYKVVLIWIWKCEPSQPYKHGLTVFTIITPGESLVGNGPASIFLFLAWHWLKKYQIRRQQSMILLKSVSYQKKAWRGSYPLTRILVWKWQRPCFSMVCATFYHGLAEIPAPDGCPGSEIINEGLNFRQWGDNSSVQNGGLLFVYQKLSEL